MNDLTVFVKADSKFRVSRDLIRERVAHVLAQRGVSGKTEVSVLVVGDRKMRQVNKQYRNLDKTTDVLSFPTYDPTQPIKDEGFFHPDEAGLVLGDIIVSYPQAVEAASRKNQMLDEAVCDLVEHGLLHLLGIHHD